MTAPSDIPDDFVDIVEGEDGTRFLRVRTEYGWTTIVSPSGPDLAQHQADAIRKAIALASQEVKAEKPQGWLQRIVWGLLWS